jgi:hypothetical protein
MHADSCAEPDAACQHQHLPKASRWSTEPDGEEEKQSAGGNGAPEGSAIVSNKREKPPIDGNEITCTEAQVSQILRDENARHPNEQNGHSSRYEPCGGG